ncbi:MAG: hypothetical protein IJK39_06940 [Bacteroidales bacterium]|nr:hypothetical protein [Bacteroidales bacterium]
MKTRLYTMNKKTWNAGKTLLMIIFFCLIGFNAYAQENVYIIDAEYVPAFDGSQLIGKTIRKYKVETRRYEKKSMTLHIIITDAFKERIVTAEFMGNAKINAKDYKLSMNPRDSANLISMSIEDPDNPDKTIIIKHSGFNDTSKTAVFNITNLNPEQNIKYVVDGKLYNDISALKGIKPAEIRRIAIYKEGSAEQLKYGKGFSVIVLDTKRQKSK